MSNKIQIGVQGGVMGWDDPWNPELCKTYLRTGERQWFPSQDPTPSVAEQNDALLSLGADFFLWHAIPQADAISRFCDGAPPMPVIIGNEYGNINRIWQDGTNRYDVILPKENSNIAGLLYDETAHLQLHPDIYAEGSLSGRYQWTDPNGKSFLQIEAEIAQAAAKVARQYAPLPVYGEYVFPVMHHTLARGGIHPCPKILKEEFCAIPLATALGAAMQYRRRLGICVDLWGQDVGGWFTRIWGFPAHSPQEFASALRLAYLHAPDMMFVENIDVLMRFTGNGFMKTEFGEEFVRFKKDFVPWRPLTYSYRDFSPRTVIVRGDEVTVRNTGNLDGSGPYGQRNEASQTYDRSVYDAFRLVTHGTTPHNGLTYFVPQYAFPHGGFERNSKTMAQLPLVKGVAQATSVHTLFVPMTSCAVFDRYASIDALCEPACVILCNTELTEACKASVDRCVENGAVCICAHETAQQFAHMGKARGWTVCESLYCEEARHTAGRYVGDGNTYEMDFTTHSFFARPIDGDKNNLSFEVIER